MSDHHQRPLHEAVTNWLWTLWAGFRTPLSMTVEPDPLTIRTDRCVDPDFDGWLHNDPMVTGNPASRYGDDAPGYVTGNGLGSLEIGAADD